VAALPGVLIDGCCALRHLEELRVARIRNIDMKRVHGELVFFLYNEERYAEVYI
jgi:hypothetical protein